MANESFKTAYQYIIPKHLISRLVGRLAAAKTHWIKQGFINWFAAKYQVNMAEAAIEDLNQYACFNDFFTRALKPDARPIDRQFDIMCPVDGEVSQLGPIAQDSIFQAKGHDYSLARLLGDEHVSKDFQDGHFATLYLSPKDYHRIHCPVDATLTGMTYIPGDLFSVNQVTARTIPNLFARNERLVVYLKTEHGPLAMVFVGATIVASIETVWSGVVTPPVGPSIHHWSYTDQNIAFKQNDELGRFRLGSTVIMVAPEGMLEWNEQLEAGSPLTLGQGLANWAKEG